MAREWDVLGGYGQRLSLINCLTYPPNTVPVRKVIA